MDVHSSAHSEFEIFISVLPVHQKTPNRSSHRGSVLTNPTRNHEVAGSIPGPAQWVKGSGFAVSCGTGHRRGSDLA